MGVAHAGVFFIYIALNHQKLAWVDGWKKTVLDTKAGETVYVSIGIGLLMLAVVLLNTGIKKHQAGTMDYSWGTAMVQLKPWSMSPQEEMAQLFVDLAYAYLNHGRCSGLVLLDNSVHDTAYKITDLGGWKYTSKDYIEITLLEIGSTDFNGCRLPAAIIKIEGKVVSQMEGKYDAACIYVAGINDDELDAIRYPYARTCEREARRGRIAEWLQQHPIYPDTYTLYM